MKLTAKILLILLMPVLLSLCVLSMNVRGQFLSSGFWTNTFENGNVYSKVSETIGDKLIVKVLEAGGKKSDVKDLSGLVSIGSIRNFSERNITGILNYANGRSSTLMVYVPVSSVKGTEDTDLKTLESYSREVPFKDFLTEYNISGIGAEDLDGFSKAGILAWIFVFVSYTLLLLCLFGLFSLTEKKKRFVAPAIGFLFSGLLLLVVNFVGNYLMQLLNSKYLDSTHMGTIFAAIIVPPVISRVIQIWLWFGISSLIVGILLFFLKKSDTNKKR